MIRLFYSIVLPLIPVLVTNSSSIVQLKTVYFLSNIGGIDFEKIKTLYFMKQIFLSITLAVLFFSVDAQTTGENWICTFRLSGQTTHAMVLSNGKVMTWVAGGEMTELNGVKDAVQVSANEEHMLILDKQGAVWALGNNSYNQLGNEDLSGKKMFETKEPVRVTGLKNVIGICAYRRSSYALLADGTVWAWGANGTGMAGDGEKSNSGTTYIGTNGWQKPTKVVGLDHIIAIAGATALKDDGTVWTWGDGSDGRLGRGDTKHSSLADKIPGINTAVAISASFYGGFALLKDGTVMSWGKNMKGQLGNGATSAQIRKEERSLVPVKVIKLSNVIKISAWSSTLALCKDGTVKGWGWGELSALGPLGGDVTSTPVHVHKLSGVKAIKAGNGAGFALLNDGTLVGWGSQMVATGVYKQSNTVVTIKKLGSLAPL
jgi:alpha-tubulin suppressor-like RCC1 family protein